MSAHPTVPVLGAAPGTTVELAPGKKFIPLPPDAKPPLAVAEWVPAGSGTWRLVARVMPRWYVLNAATMRQLGIPCSQSTLVRLMDGGFIESRRTAPNTREFSHDSYLAHLEACRDPEFWSQVRPGQKFTNHQLYQKAI